MPKPLPPVKAGDLITADLYNAVAERLERFLNLSVVPGSGLIHMEGPPGFHLLGFDPERPVMAQLSGSSSPYSWHEVQATISGGVLSWSNIGNRQGTSDAYEINGISGLGGKVVELWRTDADWRFSLNRSGSCTACTNPCHGHGNSLLFTLTGCGSGVVPGASVPVTGPTSGSGTTNSSGQFTITDPAPGSYTVSWSYHGLSGSVGATITNTCSSALPGDTLPIPTGYQCTCSGLTGIFIPYECPFPMPSTLHLTDSQGTIALNFVILGGVHEWTGSYFATIGGVTYRISYTLTCDGKVVCSWCNAPGRTPPRSSPWNGRSAWARP